MQHGADVGLEVVHEDHVLAEQDAGGRKHARGDAVCFRSRGPAEAMDSEAGRSSDDPREDPDVVSRRDDGAGPDETTEDGDRRTGSEGDRPRSGLLDRDDRDRSSDRRPSGS